MRVSILILFILMNLSKLHNALARGVFAMDPQRAEAYMPTVRQLLTTGNAPAADAPNRNQEENKAKAVHPITGQEHSIFRYSYEEGRKYVGFKDAPKGSVAVLSIQDAIMKYDYCGALGTVSLCSILADAEASDNIVGILLDMDTPGGEVYGTKNLADMVANCTKPVIAHINDGYCASAGMYIAAGAKRILMAQPTDQIGSIGVYTTLIDSRGAYEKVGYKLLTIYSPTSTEKNLAWREAMDEGKVERMEAELAFLDKIFMDTVKAGRPNVKEDALKGGMFFTDEAIAMGLCDGYATQQEAIEMCVNLSGRSMII
jgi:ClpP class serine protease